MSVRIYELGTKKFQAWEEWGVGYSTHPKFHPFFVWEDNGPEHFGATCTANELLSDAWRNHLRLCNALWLIPLLERFVAGESLTTDLVLNAYEQEHGHPAPVREM
jgi:hypothetical protein